jgi:hypothetical protein
MSGSYGGVRALARYIGLPVSVAGRWLEKQDPYTLHKPVRDRPKPLFSVTAVTETMP